MGSPRNLHADRRRTRADERERIADERDRIADDREDRADAREQQANERERRLDAWDQQPGSQQTPHAPPAGQLIGDSYDAIERGKEAARRSLARLDRSSALLARGDRRDEREQAEIDQQTAASWRALEA